MDDGKGAMKASSNYNKRCDRCHGKGEVTCSSRSNAGVVGLLLFEYCGGSGIISCSTCKTSGKVTCDKCSGDGRIECKTCYSDNIDNRYGKVDCTTCETAGELASITYIETEIKTDDLDLIFTDGKNIEAKNFGVSNIKKFANANGELTLVYKNLNGENKENYDNFSLFCSENSQKAVGISKESYPKLLVEEMYYEAVPCSTFNYNHILFNHSNNIGLKYPFV